MPYRIKRGERVGHAVRRVVRRQLEQAIRGATDRNAPPDERVHLVRTRLKRSRAALALLAGPAGKRALREDRRLRRAGRRLSLARDLAVQARTLRALAERQAESSAGSAAARAAAPLALATKLARAGRQLERVVSADEVERLLLDSARRLRRLRRNATRWSIAHDRRTVVDGLIASYRHARRALAHVQAHPTAKRFHDLRKRVKILSHELHLVEGTLRGLGALPAPSVEDLAELLGAVHDLDVVRATLERRPRWLGSDQRAALALLDQRRQRLAAEAVELARPLFSTRPRDLRAMVR